MFGKSFHHTFLEERVLLVFLLLGDAQEQVIDQQLGAMPITDIPLWWHSMAFRDVFEHQGAYANKDVRLLVRSLARPSARALD